MAPSDIQLEIPTGPLGIGIYRNEADGSCVVSKKNNEQSPLEVGDVIVRLNGVYLPGVHGGVQGWVKLFQLYANVERNVVVRRTPPGGAVMATAPVPSVVPQNNSNATRAPSVPETKQVTSNNAIHRETITVFRPTVESRLDIGLVGTAGGIKVSTIAEDTPCFGLKVGMVIESINNIKCTDAAHGVRLLKTAKGKVTIVVLHPEKTKKALQPSTYQNAKKRKADVSKPKKATNKKQVVSKKKSVTVAKPRDSSFNHDDAYMYLLENGFPDPGCVSGCQNYYVTKNNDTYKTIAEKLGLEDWKQLPNMTFNKRFYGQSNKRQVIFAPRTVIKIPKTASKWKLNKIVDNHQVEIQAMATCSKCLKKGELNDTLSLI
eukprot:scaffold27052_cov169-Skeletonema_menzelii.AAC.2